MITLKTRTKRKLLNDGRYVDLCEFYEPVKVGDAIELEYYKDAPISHTAEIVSKCNGGYYVYIPDEQPKCVINIYQNE